MSDWNAERIAALRKLWGEKLPASEIAIRLGGFTHCRDDGRSAVLGKVRRLRLPSHKKPPSTKPRDVARRLRYNGGNGGGVAANLARRAGKAFAKPMKVAKSKRAPEPTAEPRGAYKPVRLMDLTPFQSEPGQCRWIIGDTCGPETLHCGAPKVSPEVAYCDHHARVAHPNGQRA